MPIILWYMKEVVSMKKVKNIFGKLSLIILIPYSFILLICAIAISLITKLIPMLFMFLPVSALTICIWRSCGIDYSSQIYQVELFYT